eukprot:gene17516-36027_t
MSDSVPILPTGPTAAARRAAIVALTAAGQPYELTEIDGPRGQRRVYANAPASMRDLYRATISDRTFLVFEDERLTFAEVHERATRIAGGLVVDLGVRPGDRVAISMRNFPEWMLAFQAITSIGAIAVAMNSMWQTDEMLYGLNDCGARVLFADGDRMDRLAAAPTADAPPDLTVVATRTDRTNCGPHRVLPISGWLDADSRVDIAGVGAAGEVLDVPIGPDDPATILYTSGSTGRPKGVVSTHRNSVCALMSWELEGAVQAGLVATDAP